MRIVFDIEADGLYDEATKIYCLSYTEEGSEEITTVYTKQEIEEVFKKATALIGHNIIQYDLQVVKKIYGIDFKGEVIDTLGLSWYLYIERSKHGLESWGEDLGYKKIEVSDEQWQDADISLMTSRCEGDVLINSKVWTKQFGLLSNLYGNNWSGIVQYLNFKLQCGWDQYNNPLHLDVSKAKQHQVDIEFKIYEREKIISEVMPQVVVKTAPKKMTKKDGSISSLGQKWKNTLKEMGLPEDSKEIKEKGNPGSHTQLKDWLFSLGWNPKTFKVSKATGSKIPQVSLPFGAGLCSSVKNLYGVCPELKYLEDLYMLRHRVKIFETFAENRIQVARFSGFARSLRLKHSKPFVNLPGDGKPYGEEIRSCIKPSSGQKVCGSDISGLESATQDHYMFDFDQAYVTERRTPGFDPHLSLGVIANMITKEEEKFFKYYKKKHNL